MGQRDEISEIRVASTIGILLIVFGHSFVSADYTEQNPLWYRTVKDVLYGFHIHLFFLISGFLFAFRYDGRPFSLKQFYFARFIRLIAPYLAYSVVNVGLVLVIPSIRNGSVNSIDDIFLMMLNPTSNTIKFHWFLVIAFNLSLLAPALLILLNRNWIEIGLVGAFAVCIHLMLPKRYWMEWGISFTLFYLVFFFIGVVMQRCLGGSKIWGNPGLLFGTSFVVASFSFYCGVLRGEWEPGIGTMAIFRLIFSVSASFAVLGMSACYVNKGWKFLDWLSGLNLSILLLSWYGHRLADGLLNRIFGFGFSVVMPVSFLLGLLVPVVLVSMLKGRARWGDVILGCQVKI